MDLDIDNVNSLVEEQTIQYLADHPQATYADYIKLLDWYWALPANLKSGWVVDWIHCLTEGT